MRTACAFLPLLALTGCVTGGGSGLIDLKEGGQFFASDGAVAYVRKHVTLDVTIRAHGDILLEVSNDGGQRVAVDTGKLLLVLHCPDHKWHPLELDMAMGRGILFLSPGETKTIGQSTLQGFVLSPGHAVQAFYYSGDGTILRASDRVPIDDRKIERENEMQKQKEESERKKLLESLPVDIESQVTID